MERDQSHLQQMAFTSPVNHRRPFRAGSKGLVFALLALGAGSALAQAFPTRPVTLYWPFSVGGAVDTAMRTTATAAGRHLGQPVLVESRPGANGMIAFNAMRQAPADGYTLLGVTNGLVVTLPLIGKDKHEPVKDYSPISLLFSQQMVIGAHPSVPFRDLKGLIDYAKRNPGKLNIATSGTAATTTFAAALLASKAGIEFSFIPYKGATQATPDLLSNVVQLQMMGPGLKPFLDSGKLVAIAATGQKRWRYYPNVPTMIESGLSGAWSDIYFGVVAPPRTRPAVIAALDKAFNAALGDADVKAALEVMGSDAVGTSPAEFTARIISDQEYWLPVVKASGITDPGP